MNTPFVASRTSRKTRRRVPVSGLVGLAIVAFWLLMALIGPHIAPQGGAGISGGDVFAPISMLHPLGTDYLGRDMLGRILDGTPYTIGVALAGALLASTSGTALALCAAVAGGWFDAGLSRTLDAMITIPSKLFALLIVASFGSSVPLLIATAAVGYMPGAYRIARSLAVNVQAMDYVQAARVRGEGMFYTTCVEILPNMIRPVLADFGLRFVYVVLLLGGMSFLGLGIQPPNADWGSLVRENIVGLGQGVPAVIVPALAIATLTIGVNLAIDCVAGRARRGSGEA